VTAGATSCTAGVVALGCIANERRRAVWAPATAGRLTRAEPVARPTTFVERRITGATILSAWSTFAKSVCPRWLPASFACSFETYNYITVLLVMRE
jgi:hypothetical protein